MKKKVAAILLAGSALFLAGCSNSNGWTALPLDDENECFQVEQWKSDGWDTKSYAVGTYCRAEPQK